MSKLQKMQQIQNSIVSCTKCGLCVTAKSAVVGEGSLDAQIVFVGEAPGASEDEVGRPFVGRAGKLLDGLINEIGYKREDVWIGNIIKHRPPDNRDPLPEEISACSPFLAAQLEIINPKLIVTLGRFAMSFFYPSGKISKHHGVLIKNPKFNVFPVYHPAAALRNSGFANALREDFHKIPKVLASIADNTDNSIEPRINSEDSPINLEI